ncbi:MAG: type I-E CRISPR-associated protein Cse2/CasB [Aquimonas sp.]|nr:type I-E CRISPR-associated protein Cse2/CasB [Aquimonas sp.]
MKDLFKPGSESREVLRRWWNALEDDRGTRAALRRCATTLQVMQVAGFHHLHARLLPLGLSTRKPEDAEQDAAQLAVVVALLAHLRNAGDRKPALAFSTGESPGDPPPVSPLRFRQVLEARAPDELLLRLRRVLPLARGLDAIELAADAFHWSDRIRKQWVFAYQWPTKQSA